MSFTQYLVLLFSKGIHVETPYEKWFFRGRRETVIASHNGGKKYDECGLSEQELAQLYVEICQLVENRFCVISDGVVVAGVKNWD